jgi:hypothetical protein
MSRRNFPLTLDGAQVAVTSQVLHLFQDAIALGQHVPRWPIDAHPYRVGQHGSEQSAFG